MRKRNRLFLFGLLMLMSIGTTIIPELFAAGEVTGGRHDANRLGGNSVCDIVVNCKLVGENAIASYSTKK